MSIKNSAFSPLNVSRRCFPTYQHTVSKFGNRNRSAVLNLFSISYALKMKEIRLILGLLCSYHINIRKHKYVTPKHVNSKHCLSWVSSCLSYEHLVREKKKKTIICFLMNKFLNCLEFRQPNWAKLDKIKGLVLTPSSYKASWNNLPQLHINVETVQEISPKCQAIYRCQHSMNPPWKR